jgi:DNA helicase-2/ATP-dependent DNA helicase PcrA
LGSSREDILKSLEKVRLIEGEPGVGKTWFGCKLAKYELDHPQRGVQPYQKILFLTFARNAVARIRQIFSEQLDEKNKKKISERLKIDTFAGFFWWLVSSYGRYTKDGTNKKPWLIGSKEVENVIIPNGYEDFTFNKLESRAYETIKLPAISKLISELYPLVIIDEFQDVHDSLFNIIAELAKQSRLVLLRGPGQCIYRNLKQFDPDEVLKKCIDELKPEKHKLESAGDDKQRYCPEIKILVDSYNNGNQLNLADSLPVKLRLVPRKNTKGNYNSLDTFAALETRDIYSHLKGFIDKPMVAVLSNTNLAVAEIHKKIEAGSDTYKLKKRSASLYFKDELFLQYGRLILSLLPLFWIAKKRQDTVNIGEVLQALVLLFQEKLPKECFPPNTWKPLAEKLIKKAKHFKESTRASTRQEKLKFNLDTINNELRKTKLKLKKEISLDASTPFDKDDKPLLDTLSNEFVNSIEYSIDYSGTVDVDKAKKQFETTAQQKIIFEKLGLHKNVQVMTIHKSKGREFDGVVLVLEDKIGIWEKKDESKKEEIKELYNVAISRAKKAISIVAFEDAINKASEPVKRLLEISTNPS